MNTSTLNDSTGAEVWDDPGLGRRTLTWLRGDPRAALSLVVLVVILGAALLAPWLAPHDPTAQNFDQMLNGPSAEHWLGTDDLGRDVFSRLMHGGAEDHHQHHQAEGLSLIHI